jgi:peptide deformylase
VFFNPELEYGDELEFGAEGCLSIKGVRAEVKRPIDVKATVQVPDGRTVVIETDGLLARALQHEIDHLNGILFVDRLPAAAKVTMRARLKRLFGQS